MPMSPGVGRALTGNQQPSMQQLASANAFAANHRSARRLAKRSGVPMIRRPARGPGNRARRRWPTPSIMLASAALFLLLGGSAVAATGLIQAKDIATGAVTGRAIKAGSVEPQDLSRSTQALLKA